MKSALYGIYALVRRFEYEYEYEYEIEYENNFPILVCRLHIITSHTHLIPWASLST